MFNNFWQFYIITHQYKLNSSVKSHLNLQASIKYSKIGVVFYYCYSAYTNSVEIFNRGWLEKRTCMIKNSEIRLMLSLHISSYKNDANNNCFPMENALRGGD